MIIRATPVQLTICNGRPVFFVAKNSAEGSAPLSCIELANAIVGK